MDRTHAPQGRLIKRLAVWILPCALWAGVSPAWSNTPLGAERALQEMREAFRKGDTKTLVATLPRLQGHTLEPLAAYWTLRSRLDQASTEEIRAFLKRYSGSYHEDRLRNDWLLQLGRRGDWDTFALEHPAYRMRDDKEVACYALYIDHLRQQTPVADKVRDLWLTQKDNDEGCLLATKQQLATGQLPASVVWQRARWAMENNRVRAATQAVALLDTDWVPTVQAIHNNPGKYLDEKMTAIRPRTKELVTLALVRLAATDLEAATEEVQKVRWRTQLTAEEKSWVWGVIGKRSAQRLADTALPQFKQARNEHLNDEQLGWKTRAALRAGAWAEVWAAINAMGPAQRRDPAWTYWEARALLALQNPGAAEQAQVLYQRIAGTAGFYEQLALEALGRPLTAPNPPAPLTPAERREAADNPGLQRALVAIQLGLRPEGVREWNYTTNLHNPGGLAERQLLAAADLACQNEVWDRCINTSKRTSTEIDHGQRFPTPYRAAVVARAKAIGLDPAYVYGLIRQESRFITDARSGVGASGLMQVMPATASWTAKRIGLTDFKPGQITDRDTNIAIGTAYLKFALDDFEGSMPMAAAAYNAGPGRPRNWRNGPVLEAAIWIENIPFSETRDYVKRVLSNTTNYAALLTGEPQRLSQRLAPIGPRSGSAQAPNTDLP
ncbi:MAG: hypothetical protein RJA09_110 [Pseudomonadota bacterium]